MYLLLPEVRKFFFSKLSERDGMAITEGPVISIQPIEDSPVLLMEVPMN